MAQRLLGGDASVGVVAAHGGDERDCVPGGVRQQPGEPDPRPRREAHRHAPRPATTPAIMEVCDPSATPRVPAHHAQLL